MTRKEGIYSFTVYCDQTYLEKIKTSAKDSNQKLSAFVLGILDQHFGLSDNLDIEAMIANLRGSIDAELREIKTSEATNQLVIENLQANLTVAQQRIEALEVIATAKKPLMQLVKEKALAA